MGLNCESSSHSQLMAASETGIAQGSMNRICTSRLPRKSRASSSEATVASTTSTARVPSVTMALLRSASRNCGCCRICAKFAKPTKWKLVGFPTVASLNASRIASTNGMPTNAAM
ncbi:MAG: hypothetical protein P8Y02_13710 [Deinococcales bacterium]